MMKKNHALIGRLESNIKNKFSYIPSLSENMSVKNDRLLVINSQLHSDMFNIICYEHSLVKKSDVINAINQFHNDSLPCAAWVGFERESSIIIDTLESLGFKKEESELMMHCQLKEVSLSIDSQLEVRQVDNEAKLSDFIDVISALVPNETQAIEQFFLPMLEHLLSGNSKLSLFVGYEGELPVSTASVFVDDGIAGIFDIVVSEQFRGKGYGKAVTTAAMQFAQKNNIETASLTATNNAKFLYEKLGFKALKEMSVYPIAKV